MSETSFSERYVGREHGRVYARDYGGEGPAFVLMHGFPDNLGIYDELVPLLVAGGRRVVTFDFLGFGRSDKKPDAVFSFAQQVGDLKAVAGALGLGRIVPVAHDSSGMAALNYALAHPDGIASVVMLNSAYADGEGGGWPELIMLFATERLRALAMGFAQNPEQFGWLLQWQQRQFEAPLSEAQREKFSRLLQPLIGRGFTEQPSSGPAFVQLTAQFFDELRRNAALVPRLSELDVPVKLIWGERDPYLTVEMARRRLTQLRHGSLVVLPAGHWLQIDEPEMVAQAMLA